MTEKEKRLREALKEVGYWLNRVADGGNGNQKIAEALQNARDALRFDHE